MTIDPPDDIHSIVDNVIVHTASICVEGDDIPVQTPQITTVTNNGLSRSVLQLPRNLTSPTLFVPQCLLARIRSNERPDLGPTLVEVFAAVRSEAEQRAVVQAMDYARNESALDEWTRELTFNLFSLLHSIYTRSLRVSVYDRRVFLYQLIGFLKGSQEIRAVIEYHLYCFPPTTVIDTGMQHVEMTPSTMCRTATRREHSFRSLCTGAHLDIPNETGVFLSNSQGRVETERNRSLFPAHRWYVTCNYSIGADPVVEGSDSDDSLPPLISDRSHLMYLLENGHEQQVWIDTHASNTSISLFGGMIDIVTPLTNDSYMHVDRALDYSYIDTIFQIIGHTVRWRRTTRIPSHAQPAVVILPTNGLRYTAQILQVRNSRELRVCWLRDNLRDNVIWCTDHFCLITGDAVVGCGCSVCSSFAMYNGVKATYVNGYFFVRAVLTEYPMENVSTNSAQDNERIQRYNALEESIRQSVRSLMLTRDEIFENNADNTSESDEGSDDGVDAPTIHHAQMMKAVNYAPYSSANNTTSSSTNTESINGRPRSKSDTSVPRSVSVPNTRSPQTLRQILELNNKVNPLAQCYHLRGRTSKRKFKQRMRIIISDGGATSSMFTDRSLFTHYRECKNTYVKMVEGTMSEVKGIGNVGKLTDVLHVEGLVFDLVSESWCDKQGMQGHWGGRCQICGRYGCIDLLHSIP